MALMDILGPAAAGLRAGMEAERAGKREEADRFYRETQQALSALSTVTGVQTQRERLGLLREQQELAQRLAPSQIRGAEAGARLAETQASAAESALQRQEAVREALDELLRAEGEPVPYETISMLREVLEGRAGIEQVREARLRGAPAAAARVQVEELGAAEAEAGRRATEARLAVKRGLPEATVEAAVAQRARDEAVALMDVRLLNERERIEVAQAGLLEEQLEAAGFANQAVQMKIKEQQRLKQLLISRGVDPDQAMVDSYMIANKLWESPQWYREEMGAILTAISSIKQRPTIDEVRQDVEARPGVLPDRVAFIMGAFGAAGATGGALSPEGKQSAIATLSRWYASLHRAATQKYRTEDWGPAQVQPGELTVEEEEALAEEARRRRQAAPGGR